MVVMILVKAVIMIAVTVDTDRIDYKVYIHDNKRSIMTTSIIYVITTAGTK